MDGFEWDARKSRNNRLKHNVTFELAATVFLDENRLEGPDPAPHEERYFTIGRTPNDDLLYVVYTWRTYENEETICRIISARKASPKERRRYAVVH